MRYETLQGRGELLTLPEIEFIDDGPGKPVAISRVLGQRPVATFGNSDGDYEMLEYVTTGAGQRLGVIVHQDDAGREYAYDRQSHIGRLDRGLADAGRQGWHLASMRDDWCVARAAQDWRLRCGGPALCVGCDRSGGSAVGGSAADGGGERAADWLSASVDALPLGRVLGSLPDLHDSR